MIPWEAIATIGVALAAFWMRLEHRMTRYETKLEGVSERLKLLEEHPRRHR